MGKKSLFLRINTYIQCGLFAIIAIIFIIRYVFTYAVNPTFFAVACGLIIVNALFRVAYNCRPKPDDDDKNEESDIVND